MLNDIKESIKNKLLEIYPQVIIYDEYIPEDSKIPSFLITLIDQKYYKRISNIFNSEVSFKIAYYSDKDKNQIKIDCFKIQQELFRSFEVLDNFRAIDKKASLVENVLNFTFTIKYSEVKELVESKMLETELKTNLKE